MEIHAEDWCIIVWGLSEDPICSPGGHLHHPLFVGVLRNYRFNYLFNEIIDIDEILHFLTDSIRYVTQWAVYVGQPQFK